MKLNVSNKWKWICYDKRQDISVFTDKPFYEDGAWWKSNDESESRTIPFDLFNILFSYKSEESLHKIHLDGSLEKYVERPNLKVDDPVLVRGETGCWFERHFSGWNKDGRVRCWVIGKTSWTASNILDQAEQSWPYWKLPLEKV